MNRSIHLKFMREGVHILQKLRLDKRWIKEFSADVK